MWKRRMLLLPLLALLFLHDLFVINTSPSFPLGVYRKTHEPPRKGDLVLFCPPERTIFQEAMQRGFITAGLCPGGTGTMIKQLAAMSGDHVRISNEGVFVNGVLLQNSLPVAKLSDILSAEQMERTLDAGEVLLMSEWNPLSFDARYFGSVPETQICTPLIPFYLWRSSYGR